MTNSITKYGRFGYDSRNQLITAQDAATDGGTPTIMATYTYDVFGNRIQKDVWTQSSGTTTTTKFAYDGDSIWADLNSNNTLQTRYILGDNGDLIARESSTGTMAWYLPDRLGSVRNIIDNTGSLIDTITYDGFGNVKSETQPANGDRFKYTGQELDGETGLQRNGWRTYDPKIGRWLQQDPLVFGAGDPNLYRYVGNNPTNSRDPVGLADNIIEQPVGECVDLYYVGTQFLFWDTEPVYIGRLDQQWPDPVVHAVAHDVGVQ